MKQGSLFFFVMMLCTSCSWESDLFDRYADEDGNIAVCPGVCVSEAWNENLCRNQSGVWENNYCSLTQAECGYVWKKYTILDLGNGYYIKKTSNGYNCGEFNNIHSIGITGNCLESDIEKFEDSLARGFCLYGTHCLPYQYQGILESAMCSSCEYGSVMCIDKETGIPACTDINQNAQHCGKCDNPCAEGKTCKLGACQS